MLDLSDQANRIIPILDEIPVQQQTGLLCGLLIACMLTHSLPLEAMELIAPQLVRNYRDALAHKKVDDTWGLPQGHA